MRVEMARVAIPPKIPMNIAASVFATAKSNPRVATVTENITGSVTGDDNQNAITGASGTPDANNPDMSGKTVTPQTGITAPTIDAISMDLNLFPLNASRIRLPAPLAFIHAEIRIPGMTRGDIFIMLINTNDNVETNISDQKVAANIQLITLRLSHLLLFNDVKFIDLTSLFITCSPQKNIAMDDGIEVSFNKLNNIHIRYEYFKYL